MLKKWANVIVFLVFFSISFTALKADELRLSEVNKEHLAKLIKSAEAQIFVESDKTLRFFIPGEDQHKGNYYKVIQAKAILAKLQRIKILGITLPKQGLLSPKRGL